MKVIINGNEVSAEKGQTILEVARKNGIFIPTLCDSPGLEAAAMCRLCTVEYTEGGRSRFVTACNFPLRREAEVKTDTPAVREGRKLIIELLMSRCPDSKELQRLAREYKADLTRFDPLKDDCVVCGLCVRACEQVGANVLTLSGRGVNIKVNSAFGQPSQNCIGCGACAQICPVRTIRIEDRDGWRHVIIHGREASRIPLTRCRSCGVYFGPLVDLKRVMQRAGEAAVPPPNQSTCPACARRLLARRMAERHFEQYELSDDD